ncbi:MAG: cation:proton antiporter [Leptothrix sp. (in: b-proteobacteria)]
MLNIVAICLVITALLAYLNHRFMRLPTAIGVMVAALALSLALIALDATGLDPGLRQYEESLMRSIDFSSVLMQGMLSLLLFAGALHVDLRELKALRWPVAILAVLGTVASTVMVGLLLWWVLGWVGLPLPLLYCLLFGALISPTDPIAVMGILKSAGAPREIELVISGESLFNDGVGVVLFSLLLGVLASGATPSVSDSVVLLLHEAGGGLLFGAVLGYLSFVMLRSVDNYQVEVLLSLATVMGGYALASQWHVSGPLAMVVVGLIIGNQGRALAMSDTTRRYLDMFWELVDEILNAVLFVLIGMQVLLVSFDRLAWTGALLAIAVVLLARVCTVGLPVAALPRVFKLPAGAWKVLSWGGLRGGISVALALSLPAGHHRDTVLTMTYAVVVFSILIQGMSIGPMMRQATTTRTGSDQAP